jgi:hypothetical protein
MSIERRIDLECPGCGREQSVVVWESLNADLSPRAREELFEGKINVFVCESCGKRAMISIPLLYHEMTRRFAVQFFPFDATEDNEFLRRFDRSGSQGATVEAVARVSPRRKRDLAYLYDPHVVLDMGELVRYVLFRERVFDVQRDVTSSD